MTEDTTQQSAGEPVVSVQMESAIAGGYKAPEPPTRSERVAALLVEADHSHAHNGPMTVHFLRELKDLLAE